MYSINRLEISNFKLIADKKTIDFSKCDLVVLDGPNGFGKTTIFDAVELILTGKINRIKNTADKRIGYSDILLVKNPDLDTEIKIEFSDEKNSFTNNIEYKRFYLNTLFTYQIGGQTYDGNYTSFLNLAPTGAALHKDMLNAWTKPGDVTSVNKLSTNNTTQNMAASSRWLVDSDYLSLRNVTFGYNFEKAAIEKLGLTNLKLYISGENIVAWTKKQGLEPVQSFNGTTTYRYTPSRTVSVGLNVQF